MVKRKEFILDSGATSHMCHQAHLFYNWRPYDSVERVYTSTGKFLTATGEGDILIYAQRGREYETINLKNVIYVPELHVNLVSIPAIDKKGYTVECMGGRVTVNDKDTVMEGYQKKGQYVLNIRTSPPQPSKEAHLVSSDYTPRELDSIRSQPNTVDDLKEMEPKEKAVWVKAMNDEVNNFYSNHTWIPATPPEGKTPIHTRWTFKVKKDEHSNVSKVRARLVAKGYEQDYGHQYDEVYAPVIKPVTLRTMMVLATTMNMNVRHLDVDSAFLYGKLKEELYVYAPNSPPGMFPPKATYKLQAAVYGLKQAAHEWYSRLKDTLAIANYLPSDSDLCLFINRGPKRTNFLITHVDDILILSSNDDDVNHIISHLKKEFSIKDLGEIKNYLGINFTRLDNPPRYVIDQTDKIERLGEGKELPQHHPAKTPMVSDYLADKKQDQSGKIQDIKTYQSVLGEIMYLANTSRPDVSLAAGILGRSSHSPTLTDWKALVRTRDYLKHTSSYKLVLGDITDTDLVSYTDSDWGGDPTTKRSTSGGCHQYRGSLVSWSSVRQKSVTLSTAEAEYVSAVETAKESLWIHRLLNELGASTVLPIELRCDNQSAISIASSLKNSSRTKHIEIKTHYLRELIDRGQIMMNYCSTTKMLADLFTKPVAHPRHHMLTETIMGLVLTYNDASQPENKPQDWFSDHNYNTDEVRVDNEH